MQGHINRKIFLFGGVYNCSLLVQTGAVTVRNRSCWQNPIISKTQLSSFIVFIVTYDVIGCSILTNDRGFIPFDHCQFYYVLWLLLMDLQ